MERPRKHPVRLAILGFVAAILYAKGAWDSLQTISDVSREHYSWKVWVAFGVAVTIGGLIYALVESHRQSKYLQSRLEEMTGGHTHRLRGLKTEGEGILAAHMGFGNEEKLKREARGWATRVREALLDSGWTQELEVFTIKENPNPISNQEAHDHGQRLEVLSRLLNP